MHTVALWLSMPQPPPTDEGAGEGDQAVVEVEASFPADCETLEPVQQSEGLLDDIAELAQALDVRLPLREITGRIRRLRNSRRRGLLS